MSKFVSDLLAKATELRLKPSTVLLTLLVAIAGEWTEKGIHPSWGIVFVVVVFATDCLGKIAVLFWEIKRLEREHELRINEFKCVVETESKLRRAAQALSEDKNVSGSPAKSPESVLREDA
jgi:hypothetical protein